MYMKVSYMIASHNRREELLKTIQSCYDQDYPEKEILVVDDGSTDDSFEAVRRRFPDVIITRNEEPRGSVASRNQIFRRVPGEVLFGVDVPPSQRVTSASESLKDSAEVRVTAEQGKDGEWMASEIVILKLPEVDRVRLRI